MGQNKKQLILILLIAIGLRLALFLAVGSWRNDVFETRFRYGDTADYHQMAINLIENRVFSSSEFAPYHPEIFYTPGYPAFLALGYVISGNRPFFLILIQIVLGSINCLIIYKIGKIFFVERVALLSGLILAFEYSSIYYSNVLLTETLFCLLFSLHILFLVKYFKVSSTRWLVLSACFLGLATLTRPVSVYFFIFLMGYFFYHFRRKLIKGLLIYGVFTLVFIASVLPWMVRNYSVSDKFLVSTAQEQIRGWGLHYILEGFGLWMPSLHEVESGQSLNTVSENLEPPENRNFVEKTLKITRSYLNSAVRFFLNPGSSNYPRLLGLSYNEMEQEDWRNTGIWGILKSTFQKKSGLERFIFVAGLCFLIFLYIAMCYGIYSSITGNRREALLLIITVLTYFSLASISIAWTLRYRVPIMPYIILLASYGIVFFKKGIRKNREMI